MTQDVPARQPDSQPDGRPEAPTSTPTPAAPEAYHPPTLTAFGRVAQLTRGNGSTWTDYLGDTKTRYG